MNAKMKLKYLLTVPLTISLAVLLSACGNQNPPIQSDSGYSDEYSDEYQNTLALTNTEALAVGATGAATGYALAKQANKPRYSKPNASYSKPVVVVNNHYYQTKPKVRVSRYKRK